MMKNYFLRAPVLPEKPDPFRWTNVLVFLGLSTLKPALAPINPIFNQPVGQ